MRGCGGSVVESKFLKTHVLQYFDRRLQTVMRDLLLTNSTSTALGVMDQKINMDQRIKKDHKKIRRRIKKNLIKDQKIKP